jgi:hypothetical protein
MDKEETIKQLQEYIKEFEARWMMRTSLENVQSLDIWRAIWMVEKSDAMKMHEQWIEETLKRKPKHSKPGLPIEPWHVLAALGGIFVLLVAIGKLIHP